MNDREIIEKILAGQQHLFKLLVTKHKGRLVSIIYSFCGANCDYEDIAQNVFVKIFCSLNKFRFDSSFTTWLYKIAINESITFSKKTKTNTISINEKVGDDEDIELVDILPDLKDGVEDNLVKKETQDLIRKAILSLKENYRTILILKDIEDLSYDEIAEVMDISLDKVKVWLFRARQQLREVIKKGNLL